MKNLGYVTGLREELVGFWEVRALQGLYLRGLAAIIFGFPFRFKFTEKKEFWRYMVLGCLPVPMNPWHCKIINSNSNNLGKESNCISCSGLMPSILVLVLWKKHHVCHAQPVLSGEGLDGFINESFINEVMTTGTDLAQDDHSKPQGGDGGLRRQCTVDHRAQESQARNS